MCCTLLQIVAGCESCIDRASEQLLERNFGIEFGQRASQVLEEGFHIVFGANSDGFPTTHDFYRPIGYHKGRLKSGNVFKVVAGDAPSRHHCLLNFDKRHIHCAGNPIDQRFETDCRFGVHVVAEHTDLARDA